LLEEGDRVQVGHFTLCVGYDSAIPAGPPLDRGGTSAALARLTGGGGAPGGGAPGGDAPGNELLRGIFGTPATLTPWRPTDLAPAPVAPAPAVLPAEGWNADMLGGLLRQFGEMQRQMFDQSLMMMFQMFRAMHGEQVEALRDELARMDELNRELHALLIER